MTRILSIRADADFYQGTGHVMRMIALGQAWQDRGGEVRLVGSVGSGALWERLGVEGFLCIEVERVHPDSDDLALLLEVTPKGGWVALDGYHFDTGYQLALRSAGHPTLVVDDVCNRAPYDADVLLNQNIDAKKYEYDINVDALMLRGTDYCLLRREFRNVSEFARQQRKAGHNLLITLGGADADNVTLQVVRAVQSMACNNVQVKVVVGSANPHVASLKNFVEVERVDCELLFAVENMAELMDWADVAVSAAGSTCWELCRFGLPMLLVVAADNQSGIATGLLNWGAAILLDVQAEDLAGRMEEVFSDEMKLQSMRQACEGLVDGRGALRVVDQMYCRELHLRDVTEGDWEVLLNWRNHSSVQASSFDVSAVEPQAHRRWLESKLKNPECLFWMAEDALGNAVGHFRLDVSGAAVVSITVAPELFGRGVGTAITRLACAKAKAFRPDLRIVALVKPENVGSVRMFEKAGFHLVEKVGEGARSHLTLELPLDHVL